MNDATGRPVEPRELHPTAARFALKLERLTDRHGIARETFTVRARRCAERDDPAHYRVWVGLRGFVAEGAAAIVTGIHKRWTSGGWVVTDYRRLRNGGLAVGATDPDTGEEYSWDTGFTVGPDGHLAGSFTTPCYRDPHGAVDYGEIPLARLEPFAPERLRGPNRNPD